MNPRFTGRAISLALLCLVAAPVARAQQSKVKSPKVSSASAKGESAPVKSLVSVVPVVTPPLVISEFRLRGPAGAEDEFIEIYNTSSAPHTVQASDLTGGYAVAASDGSVRFLIPNDTTIPGHGHYLGVNSTATTGYSLAAYPAGNGTTATGDATYTTDIPDNVGIALFSTGDFNSFSAANRIDSVGPTTEANPLFKEGTGLPVRDANSTNYTLYRNLASGLPQDSEDNASDFVYADTAGTAYNLGCTGLPAGFACQRLGAPGPENSTSPIFRGSTIKSMLLDSSQPSSASPNRVRDFTPGPAATSSGGTLSFRRRFVNNTGANVTRLRFRIVDVTTFRENVTSPGTADLRAVSSTSVVISGVNDAGTCPSGITPCNVTVQGTTLETPPAQPNGGGFNSSLSAGTVALGTPLAPLASINVQFVLGVKTAGSFRFFIVVEALP
ncbi:MAG TPA: hypothetical protein VF538_11145 [Pyrinomonadaceae bacterium]|jgi:hypothetical protein